jgi:hypothetical protein
VENAFEWIFRPVHLEDDFGLDGYFDVIGSDNSVTGKYLGVQIKTGKSYFSSKKNFGWQFTGENKHLNYYLNSNFPILIILVDLDNSIAYWVEFDLEKITQSTNGWSIIVPQKNVLKKKSKVTFKSLVGDIIDYMPQVQFQLELNDQLKSSEAIFLNVSKKEIRNKDISGFMSLHKKLTIDDAMISKTRGKLNFFIDGYNYDKRELFQIQEVREWITLVLPAFKYWGYFLNMEPYVHRLAGLRVLHMCSVDVGNFKMNKKTKSFNIKPDIDQTVELMKKLFNWLNEFCDEYSIDTKINEEQSDKIAHVLIGVQLNK